jgi:hypothetical protein
LKTSVSIDEKTLTQIDDYRASVRPIPSMSKAVIDLIKKGLSVQEGNTELPKDASEIENLTIHMRYREGKGGSCAINLPYSKMKELGFNDKDSIDLTIMKRTT